MNQHNESYLKLITANWFKFEILTFLSEISGLSKGNEVPFLITKKVTNMVENQDTKL